MNAIEDASTQAARTIRRRCGAISRPSARGHGSAAIMPRSHGSTKGCAMATHGYHAHERLSNAGDIAGPYPEFIATASLSPHRRDGILRRARGPEENNKHAS